MKIFLSLFLLLVSASPVSASPGFICPKEKIEISKVFLRDDLSTIQIAHADGRVETNILLENPEGREGDAYQTRFSTYTSLWTSAQLSFPYMPEFLLVYHMMKSQPLYRRGFYALDGDGTSPVQLRSMYCKALVDSILKFQP